MQVFTKEIQEALNRQINAELYSAYLYLSMSAHLASKDLNGMSHWMKIQGEEEIQHAMKIFNYIFERKGKADLYAIKEPPTAWESNLILFENAYNHEYEVTKSINKLVELAEKENDLDTKKFLDWFVSEQVEEETSTHEIVKKLRLIDDDNKALLLFDKELSERKS